MLLSLYILMIIFMIGFFILSYFTKQELFWAISILLSALVMVTSYKIEIIISGQLVSQAYPYMMWLGLLFFLLSLIIGILDFFDKYSISTFKQ